MSKIFLPWDLEPGGTSSREHIERERGPGHEGVREALMQPLAPEVSSASSGHLGHQVTDVGGLARVVDQNTRHTKQGMYG